MLFHLLTQVHELWLLNMFVSKKMDSQKKKKTTKKHCFQMFWLCYGGTPDKECTTFLHGKGGYTVNIYDRLAQLKKNMLQKLSTKLKNKHPELQSLDKRQINCCNLMSMGNIEIWRIGWQTLLSFMLVWYTFLCILSARYFLKQVNCFNLVMLMT